LAVVLKLQVKMMTVSGAELLYQTLKFSQVYYYDFYLANSYYGIPVADKKVSGFVSVCVSAISIHC